MREISILLLAAGCGAPALPAQAMPGAMAPGAPVPSVIAARLVCSPYQVLTPSGRCVRKRPHASPGRRACPVGYHFVPALLPDGPRCQRD